MFAHLALVLVAGIYLPPRARRLVPERREAAWIDHDHRHDAQASASPAHRPWPRVIVGADDWRRAGEELRGLRWTLLGLWGDTDAVHMARARRSAARHRGADVRMPGRDVSLGRRVASARDPARARDPRSLWAQAGGRARRAALARSSAAGASSIRSDRLARARDARALSVPAGRRRKPASDSGRPGACRHHRARPFPLHRQRRDRGAARTAARLCPQGHRVADGGRDDRAGGAPRRTHLGRQHGRLCARLRARRRGCARRRGAAARALPARADGGARTARQSFRRHRRHLQRRIVLDHARAMRHPARAHAARRRCLLRPPADDGPRRAGRRRRRSRGRRHGGRSARCSVEVRRVSRSWSSSTTTPPRCRIAPSRPAS